jgi:antitoxin CptB
MTKSDDDLEFRRRRAVWRAAHRGMRELDLVLGSSARAHVGAMNGEVVSHFDSTLAAADAALFDWVMGMAPVPAEYHGPVLDALRLSRFTPESYHGG